MASNSTELPDLPKGLGFYRRSGGIIWVQVYVDGRRVNESCKTANIKEAIDYRNKLIARMVNDEQPRNKSLKIGSLLDDYIEYLQRERKKSEYIVSRVIEKNVRPFFGEMRVATLTTRVLESYVSARLKDGASRTTCNRELALLRSALLRRKDEIGKIPEFPVDRNAEKRSVNTGGVITREQFEALAAAMELPMRAFFVFAMECGARRGELAVIRWSQLDWDRSVIHLKAGETKNGEPRPVPFTESMQVIAHELKAWQDREGFACDWVFTLDGVDQIDRNVFNRRFKKACSDAGVTGIRGIHDARRTFVSEAVAEGFTEGDIMRATGHKSIGMHMRYNRDASLVSRLTQKRNGKARKGVDLVTGFSGLDEAKKTVLMRLATLETARLEELANAETVVEV